MAAEPFNVPDIKPQVGWRMNEQDMKNMRLLMAARRETVLATILRDLVQREADAVKQRWLKAEKRIAAKEEADGER